jgi:3-deoxy-D-manno-octulosonate 8-phosphate phosphatase (KDO 8-P phosphatase)
MIKLLILDVDGILTDGKKYYYSCGSVKYKTFCDKDWTAIKRFRALGINVVLLTGDSFNAAIAKNRNLDVIVNRTSDGHHTDKVEYLPAICEKYQVTADEIIYVGDDTFDIRIMKSVKYAFCPSDSPNVVKTIAQTLNVKAGENVVAHLFDYLESSNLLPQYELEDHLDKIYALDQKERF